MERLVDVNMSKILQTEDFVSWSLRLGVYLAGGVVLLGLLLMFGTGRTGYGPDIFPTSAAAAINGALALKPAAIVSLGLMLLILTPVFRVTASIVLFLLERDWVFTVITSVVLLILLVGLIFGKAI